MPSSLKCRILSHTEKVHNQSYQSIRIRQDMQGAAFGDLAGDNEQLFRHLDHAWKGFDPAAPILRSFSVSLKTTPSNIHRRLPHHVCLSILRGKVSCF